MENNELDYYETDNGDDLALLGALNSGPHGYQNAPPPQAPAHYQQAPQGQVPNYYEMYQNPSHVQPQAPMHPNQYGGQPQVPPQPQPQPHPSHAQEQPFGERKGRFNIAPEQMEALRQKANQGVPQLLSAPNFSYSNGSGEDPARKGREPKFDTPTAKQFHWKTQKMYQDAVDAFSNCLGLSVDFFKGGDLKSCQMQIAQCLNIAGSFTKSDRDSAESRINSVKRSFGQVSPQALNVLETQDLSLGQSSNLPAVPAPPVANQTPGWKETLSSLPIVGGIVENMPNKESIYDSALNKAFGEKWEDFKTPVTVALYGTGALAAYYCLVKPIFGSKPPQRNPANVQKTKKRRRRRRRNPVVKTPETAPSSEANIQPEPVKMEIPVTKPRRKKNKTPGKIPENLGKTVRTRRKRGES